MIKYDIPKSCGESLGKNASRNIHEYKISITIEKLASFKIGVEEIIE